MNHKDEITIEITQYCPFNCKYCSSNAGIEGEHLSFDIIDSFLKTQCSYYKSLEDLQINISGGEPLSHPRFYDILNLCKRYTANVWVYTNALSKIRFNADILPDGIRVEGTVVIKPGSIIPPCDHVHLLNLIPQGRAKNIKPMPANISGANCKDCKHILLQADGQVVKGPCRKEYLSEPTPEAALAAAMEEMK
jgi:hypothetical protein